MLDSSNKFKELINAPYRKIGAFFRVNNQTFNKIDISSLVYDSAVSNGTDYIVGGGYINSLEISIKKEIENLKEMMPGTASIFIESGSEQIDFSLGKFFITSIQIDRNNKTTKIKLQDEFIRLNGEYNSSLSYPTTAREILQEIMQLTQIEVEDNIIIQNDVIHNKLSKTSYRQALVYIAQLNNSFVRFNRHGKLDFIKLQPTTKQITKDMYSVNGLVREELTYRLKGIKNTVELDNKKISYTAGKVDGSGKIMELNNPWLLKRYLDRLYNEVRYLNFYPFDLSWRGDMSLEAGDWVTVHWGEDKFFDVPMLSYQLIYDGGLSAKSSGKSTTQAVSPYGYKGAVQRQIDYLDALITSKGNMFMEPEEPHRPQNGDMWFKPSGGYVEMYEYVDDAWVKKADTADINEIVNTFTTDEVIAKKLYGAIANFIEVNASKIVAGEINLKRLSITDGTKEVMTVRDGKLFVDLGDSVVSKADLDSLNAEQIRLLNQQQSELLKEIEARSNLGKIRDFEKLFDEIRDSNYKQNVDVLRRILETNEAVIAVQTELGNNAQRWTTYDKNVVIDNNGMTIFNNNRNSQIQINDEGITMLSGGEVVMSIRQGMLHINRGVFVDSIQIGEIVFMVYELDKSSIAARHIGGV